MSEFGKGGAANIAGIEYQIWFTVLRVVKQMDNLEVRFKPEAQFFYDPDGELVKCNFDDLTEIHSSKSIHISLKNSGKVGNWAIGDFRRIEFFQDVKKQLQKPNCEVIFVSNNPSELSEIVGRTRDADTPSETFPRIGNGKTRESLKNYLKEFNWSIEEFWGASRRISFEYIRQKDIEDLIQEHLNIRFRHPKQVKESLFLYVLGKAKRQGTFTINDIILHLQNSGIYPKSKFSAEEIKKKYRLASSFIAALPNTFGSLTGTHYKRPEVENVVNWVLEVPKNLNSSNIFLIKGEPGMGKSVFMRDLYDELLNTEIPVLGIKVDQVRAESFPELEKELKMTEGLLESIDTLENEGGIHRIVILFDQIDALSQSLSNNRNPIQVYADLISKLDRLKDTWPKLRVIISTREYDWKNDVEFRKITPAKDLKIGKLPLPEVNKVLEQLEILPTDLSLKVKDFLTTPFHLDMFSRLDYKPKNDFETLEFLFDLYWDQKIETIGASSIEIKERKAALALISDDLHETQSLVVDSRIKKANRGVEYLISNGIIIDRGKKLGFFHQAFSDYVFGKILLEENRSIEEFIKQGNNSLHIRSKLRSLLRILRLENSKLYKSILEGILSAPEIRFHIKSLALIEIAGQPEPNKIEKEIFAQIISRDSDLYYFFLFEIKNIGWLRWMLNGRKFDAFLESKMEIRWVHLQLFVGMLIENQKGAELEILQFLSRIDNSDNNRKIKEVFLVNLDDWSFPQVKELALNLGSDSDFFNDFLKKALPSQFDWAFELFEVMVEEKLNSGEFENIYSKNFTKNSLWQELDFLKESFKIEPKKTFNLAIQIYKNISLLEQGLELQGEQNDTSLFGGSPFLVTSDKEKKPEEDKYTIPGLIRFWLKSISRDDRGFFLKVLNQFKELKERNLLLSIVFAIEGEKKNYTDEILGFLKFLCDVNEWKNYEGQLWFFNAQLLGATWGVLTIHQKRELLDQIFTINEISHWFTKKEGEVPSHHWLKNNGRIKRSVLRWIPDEEFESFPEYKVQNQELIRKQEYFSQRSFSDWGEIISPIPRGRILKMKLSTFLAVVENFQNERTNYETHTGGKTELSREFGAAVQEEPLKMLSFVQALVTTPGVEDFLVEGILALAKVDFAPEIVFQIFWDSFPRLESSGFWLDILSMVRYFIKQNHQSEELLGILERAKNNLDPDHETYKPGESYISPTVRGEVARLIPYFYGLKENSEKVFQIVEQIANDRFISVRRHLMWNLGQLTHLDKNRTFSIFKYLISSSEPGIVEVSGLLLAYFIHHKWEETKQIIESFIHINEIQNHMGQVIYYSFLGGKHGSEALINKAIQGPPKLQGGVFWAAISTLDSSDKPEAIEKSLQVLNSEFEISKDLNHLLESSVRDIPNQYIQNLNQFLEKYVSSLEGGYHMNQLLNLLEEATKLFPGSTIKILFSAYKNPKILEVLGIGDFDHFAQISFDAYNQLREYYPGDPASEMAMDLIDWFFIEPSFRSVLMDFVKEGKIEH